MVKNNMFWKKINSNPSAVSAAVKQVPLTFLLRLGAPAPSLKLLVKAAAQERLAGLQSFARRNWNRQGEAASRDAELLSEWVEKALA